MRPTPQKLTWTHATPQWGHAPLHGGPARNPQKLLLFRKRAENRLLLHAYPVDRAETYRSRTIIRCTKPAKPLAKPLGFSGRISPFSVAARPKSTQGNQKYVDFSTLYEVPNSLRKFLFAIIDVDFNYMFGRMRPILF